MSESRPGLKRPSSIGEDAIPNKVLRRDRPWKLNQGLVDDRDDFHTGGEVFASLSLDLQKSIDRFRAGLVEAVAKGEGSRFVTQTRDQCLKRGLSTRTLLSYHEVMHDECEAYRKAFRNARIPGKDESDPWVKYVETVKQAASHQRGQVSQPTPPLTRRSSHVSEPLAPKTTPPEISIRPTLDIDRNKRYREDSLQDLADLSHIFKPDTHGFDTNNAVHHVLSMSTLPSIDTGKGMPELRLCTMEEAHEIVRGSHCQDPVIVCWQAYVWDPESRPIEQFCRLWVGDKTKISVQTPSQPSDEPSWVLGQLGRVKNVFLSERVPSANPINLLDLHCPISCGRPPYLNNPNCSMLNEIRQSVLSGQSAERITADADEYTWHELENWALMSQGGNTTAPHTDSHGLATWIAPQEAGFGFGWLSRPTKEELVEWAEDRLSLKGERWRYVFLEPGQAIFFPSGTLHYVFRTRESRTLAFGGHILQWSNIEYWLDLLDFQLEHPNSTNEDMGDMLAQMLKAVDALIGEKINRKDTSLFSREENAIKIRSRVKLLLTRVKKMLASNNGGHPDASKKKDKTTKNKKKQGSK